MSTKFYGAYNGRSSTPLAFYFIRITVGFMDGKNKGIRLKFRKNSLQYIYFEV